jgi:hypothetical protein
MSGQPGIFRIGLGYIDYWMHEPEHWTVSDREQTALADLDEALRRLIGKRNVVETARRAFVPVSTLDTESRPPDQVQVALFEATQDFYLTFYATLSSFVSALTRFKDALGDVPHVSNGKFLTWLETRALMPEITIPLLQEARQFRAILDHKASHQPYKWGTTMAESGARVMLHGECSRNGNIPDGALRVIDGLDEFPEETGWTFVAPDEDRVLAALALQLNAMLPRIQPFRANDILMRHCKWETPKRADTPSSGYPILAHAAGTVEHYGPGERMPRQQRRKAEKKPKSQVPVDRPIDVDQILSAYFDPDGNLK